MKKIVLGFLIVSLVTVQVRSQVKRDEIKGVWRAVGIGELGNDSIVTFGIDTNLALAFPLMIFSDVHDLISKAKTEDEKTAYFFMQIPSSMFIQFDGKKRFAKGLYTERKGSKLMTDEGKYKVKNNILTTETKRRKEIVGIELENGYLITTNKSGRVLYMKKISETLYQRWQKKKTKKDS